MLFKLSTLCVFPALAIALFATAPGVVRSAAASVKAEFAHARQGSQCNGVFYDDECDPDDVCPGYNGFQGDSQTEYLCPDGSMETDTVACDCNLYPQEN